MPVVELPNGKTIEFPEGTPESIMQAEAEKLFPSTKEPDTWWGGAVKGAIEGMKGGALGAAKGLAMAPVEAAKGAIHTIGQVAHGQFGDIAREQMAGLKALPGAIADLPRQARVEPERFGRTMGNLSGQALMAAAAPRVPGVARSGVSGAARGVGAVAESVGSHPFAFSLAGAHQIMSGNVIPGVILAAAPPVLKGAGQALKSFGSRVAAPAAKVAKTAAPTAAPAAETATGVISAAERAATMRRYGLDAATMDKVEDAMRAQSAMAAKPAPKPSAPTVDTEATVRMAPPVTATTGKAAKMADVSGGSESLGQLMDRMHGPEVTAPRINPAGHGTFTEPATAAREHIKSRLAEQPATAMPRASRSKALTTTFTENDILHLAEKFHTTPEKIKEAIEAGRLSRSSLYRDAAKLNKPPF